MNQWVQIAFDCLPLRSVARLEVPIDASPEYQVLCQRVRAAIETHGAHNTYYLYNGTCTYHLTNREDVGMIQFRFQGTVMTDQQDRRTAGCDLEVELARETCDWLTEPIVAWLADTVRHAVSVEFDRFIEAGDLEKTRQRLARLEAASDEAGGYLGMYL